MITDPKILTILGDSLALVRPEDNICEKDLYPYKIQQALNKRIYVNTKAVKNNTSAIENSLSGLVYHIQAASASYAIIGLGIVDCSPRLFSKKMKQVLDCATKIPYINKIAHRYIAYHSNNRFKLTKKKSITETSVEEYRENMKEIISNLQKYNPIEKIFLITIAFPGPYLTERSWGIEQNIRQFNDVLYELSQLNTDLIHLVDVFSFTQKHPEYILSDGHHISVEVHDFIATEVIHFLKTCNYKQ